MEPLVNRELVDCFSHGIRTPLNSIIGFAELLKAELDNNDPGKHYSQQIEQSAVKLLEFCDSFIIQLEAKELLVHEINQPEKNREA